MLKRLQIFIIVLIILGNCSIAIGQNDSLSRVNIDTFFTSQQEYILTKNLILENSILVTNTSKKAVSHLYNNNAIVLQEDFDFTLDTLLISYRFYDTKIPDSLGRTYKTGIESKIAYITLDIPQNKADEDLLPKGLNYSGSFGRGLTAGNSQSLVLNSTFNMQLGGKIGDDINLRAVISDANIPIQAEGTTQQLQEFDQVFIELSKDKQKLIAGDYRLNRPNGHFINYSKKLKGLLYENTSIYTNNGNLAVSGSFAISGGKFSRNQVQTNEGNQGPYKLQGADNEQFIIVQSGSEKVYLDGELLVRGENNDYVIYYDRAELIFTEKRPITKDSRIIIDFEYLVQNYARSISTANATWTKGKHEVSFRLYDESDNKNSTGIFELTPEDRMFLSDAGDDPNKVLLPGIFTNEMFDQNGVFYEIFTDTSGNTYLQYSTNENEAIYQAIFTDVGAGNGSYEIDEENNLNGRVYKYVGENQGRYNPVRKLIPPERKQMFSVGEIFNYSKKGQIQAEISLSNFDKNLFSNIDQEDNLSYAARMDWNHKFQFSSKKKTAANTKSKPLIQDSLKLDSTYALKLPKNTLEIFAFGEYLDNHFNILNPYRNAEFQRDWNLILDSEQSSELLAGAGFNWSRPCVSCDKKTQKLNYEISTFQRGNIYSGTKQNIRSEFFTKSIAFEQSVSYLNTNSRIFNSTFIRPRGTFDKRWDKLGKMHTGIFYDGEYNNKEDAILDTLLQGSNEYDLYKIYVSSDDSKALKTEIFYTRRIDRIASNNLQKTFAEADNYGANLGWAGKKTSFNMNLTYRILETQESLNQSIEDAETFLGGLDYQYNLWDGIVRGVTNFNFNSGQEPKREFDYQEVAPGEGNFIWVDDGDGIADKNEFQPAPFADQGNYIQVSLFNNEFIQVYKQDYIQTLRIEPIKWKLSKKKWLKSLSRLSSQTSLRLSRKDMQENGLPDFQFYVLDETDADIVSFSSSINQSVFWNRGNPAYDILFNYLDNTSSLLLTTGNEIRSSELYSLKYRQNIKKTADLEFIVKRQNRSLRNINFNNNDYAITGYDGEINLSYRYKRKMEFRTAMKYNLKDNLLGIEQARSISNVSGISYTNTQKFRIDSQVSFNNIQYLSSDNQTIELVMLEGLKNGNNFLWELRFTKRLINNFDLSVSYNGRKTGTSKTVHVANAQIKATF